MCMEGGGRVAGAARDPSANCCRRWLSFECACTVLVVWHFHPTRYRERLTQWKLLVLCEWVYVEPECVWWPESFGRLEWKWPTVKPCQGGFFFVVYSYWVSFMLLLNKLLSQGDFTVLDMLVYACTRFTRFTRVTSVWIRFIYRVNACCARPVIPGI